MTFPEISTGTYPSLMTQGSPQTVTTLRWVSCLGDGRVVTTQTPLWVRVPSQAVAAKVTLSPEGRLQIEPGEVPALVNGARFSAPLPLLDLCTLQAEGLLAVIAPNESELPTQINPGQWALFDAETGEAFVEAPPAELAERAQSLGRAPHTLACAPVGLPVGFSLSQAMAVLVSPTAPAKPTSLAELNIGRHICPVCWTRFDAGDALSVAVHETLRGDPVLGSDVRLRFHPTRFNDQGLALDPMGLACTDLACPHCRRQLPPGFLEMPHRIFSLIGAPSAGKSYYLAVATQVLQERLPADFGLAFRDGDPSGNMLLSQMRNALFSARSPEEALLGKTALEGATYERLPRLGRMVSLPRPFIYNLSRPGTDNAECSLIFYDNAGEHFEPGIDIHDSPGALHVATSAGLLFLFDPTANARFKRRLSDVADPQLSLGGRVDQQDAILAELESRMKRVLGLPAAERIHTPLAFMVGKSDAWAHLLPEPLESEVSDGKLDLAALDRNSQRVRQLLIETCPGLVATAESLAAEIRYFGVTSFGHTPVVITSGPNQGRIAPDPHRLAPAHVETPLLWLLTQACPGLLPLR